jgi:ATP-dependent Lhr-like helicase
VSLPFSSETRTWFESAFAGPTEVQRRGWEAIALGHHALLVAPTGSGKTLAAFLWSIDRLLRAPRAERPGTRVLYVSPLKALVHDVERNLRAPLAGICAKAGADATARVRVAVRTGDTSQRERRLQARAPGEILVTTPESLYLLLGSRARETLATVDTVIVDEVHALAPAKRGAHLALSLERLAALTGHDPQRIGLSATVNPMPLVAGWLGGDREVRLVDASQAPRLRLEVVVPVPDMERVEPPVPPARAALGGPILAEPRREQAPEASAERGIWAALYPRLLEDIRASRSTIVFVNSRGLCERLTQRINDLAGEELALAHHGSVSHERRTQIEEGLKSGGLKAIVATSSLELGIDMGAVDRVLLVESPGSVARGLQRVGRAGHGVGEVSSGTIYPKYRGDLLECAAVARRMLRGEIEQLRVPRNPLDVLAQQVVAMCCDAPRTRAEIVRIVRRAWSYRQLTDEALDAVLEMLAGRYADGDLADLRPRLAWDRADNVLSARRGAALVTRLNAGTIPDRGTYAVHLGPDGPRLGELDEEMVFETRAGETVRLGASTWRVEEITTDRVVVSPAPGEPGRLPFWRGDGPGRPLELGHAVGALARELGALEPPAAMRRLAEEGLLDAHAASNLVAYLHQQRAATGVVPSDRAIVVERFRDELGDWRVCILTPFGARVHAPWAMAIQHRLGAQRGYEVQLMYTDDGIVVRFAEAELRRSRGAARARGAASRRRRGARGGDHLPRRHRALRRAVPRKCRACAGARPAPARAAHATMGATPQGQRPARRRASLPRVPGSGRDLPPGARRRFRHPRAGGVAARPGLALDPDPRGRDPTCLAVCPLAGVRLRGSLHLRAGRAACRAPGAGADLGPRAARRSAGPERAARPHRPAGAGRDPRLPACPGRRSRRARCRRAARPPAPSR